MHHPTFDLGTDGLISEEPTVTEWIKARARGSAQPLTP